MPHLNFTLETNELNQFVEDFLKRKSQHEAVYAASLTDVQRSSSSVTQDCDVEGESSSVETYKNDYLNLPHHLKSCLDYCSFVTERCHEDKAKLVRLLVAEGLVVQENSDSGLEDVAASIIEELSSQEMLEEYPSCIEHVQVPSPLRQLCNEAAHKEEFLAETADLSLRLCILDDGSDELSPHLDALPITSLFVVTAEQQGLGGDDGDKGHLTRALMQVICRLKSLVVLDFHGEIECLPDEIGDLVHLKYLCLFHSHLQELPRTIGKLQNLQTLDVKACSLKELPAEVLDIQQLRHLILSQSIDEGEIRVPKKIGEMKNLQTLSGVYAGDGIADELMKLTQLQELKVMSIPEDHACDLSAAIMKMQNLVSLSLGVEIAYFSRIFSQKWKHFHLHH